jgi:hypothetical protein
MGEVDEASQPRFSSKFRENYSKTFLFGVDEAGFTSSRGSRSLPVDMKGTVQRSRPTAFVSSAISDKAASFFSYHEIHLIVSRG